MAPTSPPRRIGFAWRALAHRKLRTAVGVSGIAFAILFMFMQLGFRGAVLSTALAVSSRLQGDLVLVSARFLHLGQPDAFPRSRLYEALGVPEVQSAVPLYASYAHWEVPASGRSCSMFALAFPPDGPAPLALDGLGTASAALREPGSVLADRLSQDKCGVGTVREVRVRDQATRLVGEFALGVGFLGDGALLASEDTFAQLFSRSLDTVEVGVLRLRPGADPLAVSRSLREVLPSDTRVLLPAELGALQTRYWAEDTSIGAIFGLGAVVGFVVGTMILYQVLSTDIRNQLPQYATLKAMGFGNGRISLLVLQQSWLYALLGYLPGTLLGSALYVVTWQATRVPMAMSPGRALLVLGLSLAMCTLSALFTLRRVVQADPAELF